MPLTPFCRIMPSEQSLSSKRIAILTSDINYLGGAEKVALNLYHSLTKVGYDVDLVSLFSKKSSAASIEGIDVIHKGLQEFRSNVKRNISKFATEKKIRAACVDYDIVIGNNVFNYFAIPSKKAPYKQVEINHNSYYENIILYKGIRKIIKKLTLRYRNWGYKRLDKLVVITRGEEPLFRKVGVDTFYIPNYLATTTTQPKYSKEIKNLLFIASLEPRKGIADLLKVWDILSSRHSHIHLNIYGRGKLLPLIESYIENKGQDCRLHYRGTTISPLEAMSTHDLQLLTSYSEGLCLVLIEALSVGTPSVAYDCKPGNAEIITHGQDGYLVPIGDVEAMVERIDYLIRNPAEFSAMSQKSTQNAIRFSEEAIIPRWIELIESL